MIAGASEALQELRPTALYRAVDAAGNLLYVGISCDPSARFALHSHEKFWWPDVASIAIDWLSSRPAALIAEQRAITNEHPRYNRARPRHDPERIGRRSLRRLVRQQARASRTTSAEIASRLDHMSADDVWAVLYGLRLPGRDRLVTTAVALGLTYEQVTETITLGLERW